jgi:hypothetical protein
MDIASIVERVRRTVVFHPNYDLSYKRLYNNCALAQPATLVTLVGPTRVGKTMLSYRLASELVGHSPDVDPQKIPIVRIEAATTDQGFVSTRYLTLQLLSAIGHPFHADGTYEARWKDSESKLRRQLLSGLRHRGTRYLVIDEAHHLLRTKSNRLAESVLDSMKCLGNESQCVIVFIGGYEILRHQFRSAHLNGRLQTIEFSNYGVDREGTEAFDRLLFTLDELLPWRRGQSMSKHRNCMYDGTLGCYGQLVHWTIGALAEMWAKGESTLGLRHFTSTRQAAQVDAIREDIETGKTMLRDLGDWNSQSSQESTPRNQEPKPRPRPFQRKPKRDPVGTGEDHSE